MMKADEVGFTVGNVKEVVARGVEIESGFAPGSGLCLTAGVTYADTRYGDDLAAANVHLASKRDPLVAVAEQPVLSSPVLVEKVRVNRHGRPQRARQGARSPLRGPCRSDPSPTEPQIGGRVAA